MREYALNQAISLGEYSEYGTIPPLRGLLALPLTINAERALEALTFRGVVYEDTSANVKFVQQRIMSLRSPRLGIWRMEDA